MPNLPKFSRPVRLLLRFGLALLILAAGFVILRTWLDARGRAILAKYPARAAHPAKPAMPPALAPGTRLVSEIPAFAGLYSADAAERAAFDKLKDELDTVAYMAWDGPDSLDFPDLLRRLGQPVPEGMTKAQAAAAFIQYCAKFAPLLASLREAAAAGPWDFGFPPHMGEKEAWGRWEASIMLVASSVKLLATLTHAHWATGEPDAALSAWQDMASLSLRANDPGHSMFSWIVGKASEHFVFDTASRGLASGSWRDQDLPALAGTLTGLSPLDSFRHGMMGEREFLAVNFGELRRDPFGVATSFDSRPNDTSVSGYFQRMYDTAATAFMSETQIDANYAILDHRLDVLENSFNYREHTYLPPTGDDAVLASSAPRPKPSLLDDWYFHTANFDVTRGLLREAITQQTLLDHTRLALALESQKRATGSYPDSLDAVTPSFPAGLPHDVATGQPFSYQKNPDGTYKLWGTGIDQTNNGGNPDKDVVFQLPKAR